MIRQHCPVFILILNYTNSRSWPNQLTVPWSKVTKDVGRDRVSHSKRTYVRSWDRSGHPHVLSASDNVQLNKHVLENGLLWRTKDLIEYRFQHHRSPSTTSRGPGTIHRRPVSGTNQASLRSNALQIQPGATHATSTTTQTECSPSRSQDKLTNVNWFLVNT